MAPRHHCDPEGHSDPLTVGFGMNYLFVESCGDDSTLGTNRLCLFFFLRLPAYLINGKAEDHAASETGFLPLFWYPTPNPKP